MSRLAACAALCLFVGFAEAQGLAPDPANTREAVVQVYGARALGVKGLFGVHTWIATKATGERDWTIYEVVGWRLRWSDSAVVVRHRQPDAPWFGSQPELYADKRGPGVDALIKRIESAARDYPYAGTYRVWPGPNSNTFVAHIARSVPELAPGLLPMALGKDFTGRPVFAGPTPSHTGVQLSVLGLAGVSIGWVEGLELNLFGLVAGLDLRRPAVKLPGWGRIGLPTARVMGAGGGPSPLPARTQ